MFKKLHLNISLAEALALMPKYHKMLKDLLSDKEKLLGLANTSLTKNCSAVLLKKLLEKLGDPGKFLIPCDFPKLEKCMALANLGANINLMPLSVWKKLMLPKLVPTRKFTFPADFVVVNYDVDPRVSLILGRPFLRTARALVDVYKEELILRGGDEKLIFHAESTARHPHKHGNESINMINLINITCEDHFDEVLKIQKSIHCLSGSPTPSNLVVDSLVEETYILLSHFNYSSPDYETFFFDIEENSSGSTTSHSYHSLLEYESFCFDVNHIEEKSSCNISHFQHVSQSMRTDEVQGYSGDTLLGNSVMSFASSAVTYTSVITTASEQGWPLHLQNYCRGPEHPPSPDYVPGPEHPPSPVEVPYVPEPEYPEYLAPSDAEAPLEDQPLPINASPTALSPGYVADSDPKEDPEEDHADYPANGGDDDDTDDEDEEPFEDEDDDEEEEEHLALADSSVVPVVDPVPSAGDTKAFETDESAPTPRSPQIRIPFAQTRLRRARKTVKLEPPMSSSMEACIAEFAAAPAPLLPPPSLLSPWSPPLSQIPLPPLPPLPSSLHLPPPVPTSLPLPSSPLPPLPVLLFIPPLVDRREDILE
ncbi:hypothetical protein Tco_1150702, partial [Tanacetum coccineum]